MLATAGLTFMATLNFPDLVSLKRGELVVELDMSILTTENLRRTFRVDPAEVWLRSEEDNKAYFPTGSGQFRLDGSLLYGSMLIVEGPEITLPSLATTSTSRTVSSTASSNGNGASASYQSNPPPPAFRSVVPGKSKADHTVSVKIVKANMEYSRTGKIEFEQLSQMHMDLRESSANVNHVKEEVQRRWGHEFTLVTIDGLELEDCEGNRGLKFWKQPRRKVFAVSKSDLKGKGKQKRRKMEVELLSSDSEEEPISKKIKSCCHGSFNELKKQVSQVAEQVGEVNRSISSILTFTRGQKVPIWLQRLISETFKCRICLNVPITPPVIMSRCCKTVLGCEACVNEWYSGTDALTKTYPSCRAERGYSETMLVRGFDSFLVELESILKDQATNEQSAC